VGVGIDDFHGTPLCLSFILKFLIDRVDEPVSFQAAHDRSIDVGSGFSFFQLGSVSAIMSSTAKVTFD